MFTVMVYETRVVSCWCTVEAATESEAREKAQRKETVREFRGGSVEVTERRIGEVYTFE